MVGWVGHENLSQVEHKIDAFLKKIYKKKFFDSQRCGNSSFYFQPRVASKLVCTFFGAIFTQIEENNKN